MKQILCPVDFSEFSRHAFDRAMAVAGGHDATVTALHVFPVPSAVASVPFGPEGPGPFALHGVDREQMVLQLKRFLALEGSAGVRVDIQVLEAPSVHGGILLQADRLSADLIVMGTHGRSGFDRLLMGSVTEKVLRKALAPVMTVPSRAPDLVPPTGAPFERILCPVDFSADSVAGFHYAAALARDAGAKLTLIHVVELLPIVYEPMVPPPFDTADYRSALERASRTQLHRLIPESLRGGDIDKVVTSGRAYAEILRVARERQADLIVVGVRGRNALDRVLFGSTTEQILRRAACPVLTVRTAHADA